MIFNLKEQYPFLIVVALIFFSVLLLRGIYKVLQLPYNRPETFLQNINSKQSKNIQKTIICIGDSITHGVISSNYVENVVQSLGKTYNIINAGINSNLAWNIVQRLPQIIACKPDYVTILIGTNDALGSHSLSFGEWIRKKQGLPEMPSIEFYQKNLQIIVSEITQKTGATIFMMTLPPICENLQDPINKKVQELNQIIKTCAKKNKVKIIDIFPLMESQLKDVQAIHKDSKPFENSFSLMIKSVLKYFILDISWNQVALSNNLHLLTDNIHLTDKAAQMISNEIISAIKKKY